MLTAIAGCALLVSTATAKVSPVTASEVSFGPEAKYTGYLARPSGKGRFQG